jgi:hypothetical protein
MKPKSNGARRRREYLAAGATAVKEYERTGIAYALKDVERYILGVAAGKKPQRPKPIKNPRI